MDNKTPLALKLADALDAGENFYGESSLWYDHKLAEAVGEAAAELRRLHAENEALKKERDTAELMSLAIKARDEALLRQALEALAYWLEHGETPGSHDMIQRTHDALQDRLIPQGVGKGVGKREHITDGSPCWCNPETTYTDPDTGVSVIVHKEPQ